MAGEIHGVCFLFSKQILTTSFICFLSTGGIFSSNVDGELQAKEIFQLAIKTLKGRGHLNATSIQFFNLNSTGSNFQLYSQSELSRQ